MSPIESFGKKGQEGTLKDFEDGVRDELDLVAKRARNQILRGHK